MKNIKNTYKNIDYYRINYDINGNPRYVIHFLNFAPTFDEALQKAKELGGKKYRANWYGGGIVFQSYNIYSLIDEIIQKKISHEKIRTKNKS